MTMKYNVDANVQPGNADASHVNEHRSVAPKRAAAALKGCEVVFVLPHLGPGGAQRVATLVANQWAIAGIRVGLITTLDDKADAHSLNPAVVRVRLVDQLSGGGGAPPSLLARALAVLRRHRIVAGRGLTQILPAHVIRSWIKRVLIPTLFAWVLRARLWRIERVRLALARVLLGYRERHLRLLLKKASPPRVFSLLTKTNVLVALAAWDLRVHLVLSERNDPDLQQLDPLWQLLRTFAYGRADWLTSNAGGILEKMQRFTSGDRLRLLPNPLLLPDVPAVPAARTPGFVSVARLVHQKGIDILLRAFARVADQLPEWRLSLIGDGPLRDELTELAHTLAIADRVTFHGHVGNPLELMNRSQAFVLSSRFEGMPNSLLEAMALGLPPIVNDASPGPLEIVIDGETGLVVPVENVDALAAAMLRIAREPAYRERLGAEARASVGKHNWAVVEETWRSLLQVPSRDVANGAIMPEPVETKS